MLHRNRVTSCMDDPLGGTPVNLAKTVPSRSR